MQALTLMQKSRNTRVDINDRIVSDLVANDVSFVTTVPCKQLAGVIDAVEACPDIYHIPANKEDEGMGLCAGAFMGLSLIHI